MQESNRNIDQKISQLTGANTGYNPTFSATSRQSTITKSPIKSSRVAPKGRRNKNTAFRYSQKTEREDRTSNNDGSEYALLQSQIIDSRNYLQTMTVFNEPSKSSKKKE